MNTNTKTNNVSTTKPFLAPGVTVWAVIEEKYRLPSLEERVYIGEFGIVPDGELSPVSDIHATTDRISFDADGFNAKRVRLFPGKALYQTEYEALGVIANIYQGYADSVRKKLSGLPRPVYLPKQWGFSNKDRRLAQLQDWLATMLILAIGFAFFYALWVAK